MVDVLQMCADVCNSGLCDGGTVNTGISGSESRGMFEKHRPNGSSNQVGRHSNFHFSYLCVAAKNNIKNIYIYNLIHRTSSPDFVINDKLMNRKSTGQLNFPGPGFIGLSSQRHQRSYSVPKKFGECGYQSFDPPRSATLERIQARQKDSHCALVCAPCMSLIQS